MFHNLYNMRKYKNLANYKYKNIVNYITFIEILTKTYRI